MAGATNRALKAAGIPKATIATLRVEHGSGLSLRSALGIAHERGLPVGKAAEFHAAREAKHAASPAGQAAAADFRAKAATAMKAAGERKAALRSAIENRQRNLTRAIGAATDRAFVARSVSAMMTRQMATQRAAEAALPKWSPKGRQNTPDNAQRMADMLRAGTAAVRAAGTPEKGMIHVFNPHSGKTATLKALSTKGGAAVVRDRVRQESNAPEQYQVIHKGTGIGVGRYYKSRTDATEAASGLSKSLDRTIERMKSGDARAGEALYRYSVRKSAQIASRPSPQEARAQTRQAAKEKAATKEAEFNASWRAKSEKRDARRLAVAQRLTSMVRKAKSTLNKAGVDVYHAQLDAKKNGWDPVRAAERKAESAEARVKHLEARAKKLRVDPKRTYSAVHDLLY